MSRARARRGPLVSLSLSIGALYHFVYRDCFFSAPTWDAWLAATLPIPDDAAIKAFVAYLGNNGIKLEADERSWWVVTDPKRDGYKPWA